MRKTATTGSALAYPEKKFKFNFASKKATKDCRL